MLQTSYSGFRYLAITPLSEVSALDSLYNNPIELGMRKFSRHSETLFIFFKYSFYLTVYLHLEGVLC